VVLWGDGLPVETVARAAGTIGYELLCRVGSRVPRVVGVT
jgi:alanine racemase